MGSRKVTKLQGLWIVHIFSFIFLISTSFSTTPISQNIDLLGRVGGAYYAVAYQSTYAYIAEGGGMSIMDISDPSNPQHKGSVSFVLCPRDGIRGSGNLRIYRHR